MPAHRRDPNASYLEKFINKFEELNEHYDGTVNQLHFLLFLTEKTTNEVYTYNQIMKQQDKLQFIEAM